MSYGIGYWIIAFLLDGVFSLIVPLHSLFRPLFSFLAIFFLFPFFPYQKKRYLFLLFFFGLAYDLVYTNTGFLHGLLFFLFGYLIVIWNRYFVMTFWNTLWMSVVLLISYRIVSYLLLVFLQVLPFQMTHFLVVLCSSFLLNLLFVGLSYGFLQFLVKKKQIHKIA